MNLEKVLAQPGQQSQFDRRQRKKQHATIDRDGAQTRQVDGRGGEQPLLSQKSEDYPEAAPQRGEQKE